MGTGWLPPEKIFSRHFEKYLLAMQLKLTEYVRITISHLYKPKTCEIWIFRTFIAKFPIFAYILLKIGYFELGDDYEVTVMSYFGCWYLCMERGDP